MISDEIYDKYEAIFFSFINNTVKYDDIENKFKITPDPFTEVMRDAFGGHPNKENLKKFFTHEVIQNLWWKQWEVSDKCKPIQEKHDIKRLKEFIISDELEQLLRELDIRQMKSLKSHTNKFAPAGLQLFFLDYVWN